MEQTQEYKNAMRFVGEVSNRQRVVADVRTSIHALIAREKEVIDARDVVALMWCSGCYEAFTLPNYPKFWNAVHEIARHELWWMTKPVESLAGAFDAFAGDSSYF